MANLQQRWLSVAPLSLWGRGWRWGRNGGTSQDLSLKSLGWWALAGVLLGLAVGTKYVALLGALLGPVAVLAKARRPRDWVVAAAGGALALVVALAVFVGTNPAVYPDPVGQTHISLAFLRDQAEGMRHSIPSFRSPFWVAAQIVDRAVWPLGFPVVVDASMPEPLIPGNYGTPVVALGAAIALVWLWRPPAPAATTEAPPPNGEAGGHPDGRMVSRRSVAIAGAWTLAVFVLLAFSVPIWWERWHLPLVPPLVLLAATGLAGLPRPRLARCAVPLAWLLVGAQYVAALALLPSFLGRGFGALVLSPVGALAHLAALALALFTLVSLSIHLARGERA